MLKFHYKSVEFQHCHESALGHLHVADLPHALLALLLLLEELALTGNISAVALGQHVLAHCLDGLAGNDLRSDGGLYRYLELLTRNQLLELLADAAAEIVGPLPMNQGGKGVDRLAVEQDVQLD